MGEALGDPKELEWIGLEVEAFPFAEVWGIGAEIDCDVPNMAGKDANELPLRLSELIMEAAEDTFGRERLVILDEMSRQMEGGEPFLVINFCEPAATISETLGFQQLEIPDGSVLYLHSDSVANRSRFLVFSFRTSLLVNLVRRNKEMAVLERLWLPKEYKQVN